jgi:hypothetical protein
MEQLKSLKSAWLAESAEYQEDHNNQEKYLDQIKASLHFEGLPSDVQLETLIDICDILDHPWADQLTSTYSTHFKEESNHVSDDESANETQSEPSDRSDDEQRDDVTEEHVVSKDPMVEALSEFYNAVTGKGRHSHTPGQVDASGQKIVDIFLRKTSFYRPGDHTMSL